MRTAFSSIAWNTGSNSPGDELMTRSTSEVAVCCSSDSLSSSERCCSASNSLTFSIAITLVGESGHQLNLLVCEWTHRGSPQGDHSNRRAFSQERNTKQRAKSASLLEGIPVFRISHNVEDMNDFTFKQN